MLKIVTKFKLNKLLPRDLTETLHPIEYLNTYI